jgi:hypothetical protein
MCGGEKKPRQQQVKRIGYMKRVRKLGRYVRVEERGGKG